MKGDRMDRADIANRFTFHPASELTGPQHGQIRVACEQLAGTLNDLLPDGREKSLAITNVEQSMFWANAAIARQKHED